MVVRCCHLVSGAHIGHWGGGLCIWHAWYSVSAPKVPTVAYISVYYEPPGSIWHTKEERAWWHLIRNVTVIRKHLVSESPSGGPTRPLTPGPSLAPLTGLSGLQHKGRIAFVQGPSTPPPTLPHDQTCEGMDPQHYFQGTLSRI